MEGLENSSTPSINILSSKDSKGKTKQKLLVFELFVLCPLLYYLVLSETIRGRHGKEYYSHLVDGVAEAQSV